MTATEKLRALLDERGVEWESGEAACMTKWTNANGQRCSAMYWNPTFTVCISDCDPQQAVDATLGRGECEDASKTFGRWTCSECGRSISVALTDEPPRFCCGCGKAVKR